VGRGEEKSHGFGHMYREHIPANCQELAKYPRKNPLR
jgi:hypothetical protein